MSASTYRSATIAATQGERLRPLVATGLVYLLFAALVLSWRDRPAPIVAASHAPRLVTFLLPKPIVPPPPPIRHLAKPTAHPPRHRISPPPPITADPAPAAPDPAPPHDRPVIAAPLLAGPAPTLVPGDGSLVGLGSEDGQGRGGDGQGDGDRYGAAAWIRQPTTVDMKPFWPARATRAKLSGDVMLDCEVHRPGRPTRCAVETEAPAGYGFGAAAVAMSRLFLVRPVTRNGRRLDLPVRIPVSFVYKDAPRRR